MIWGHHIRREQLPSTLRVGELVPTSVSPAPSQHPPPTALPPPGPVVGVESLRNWPIPCGWPDKLPASRTQSVQVLCRAACGTSATPATPMQWCNAWRLSSPPSMQEWMVVGLGLAKLERKFEVHLRRYWQGWPLICRGSIAC
eukprot:3610637-Rhodomonas_salina.1